VPDDSPGILKRLERWGTAAENASLVILLTTMIVLAVGQIVLRLFFNFGFVWTDELIKLIVLWIALIASVAAARNNRHLRIDVLSHFVPDKYARFPRIIVEAFAASMCAVLAWYSWQYVQLTLEFEDTVLVDVPAWIAYLVLPLSFALMAYRFLLTFIGEVMMMFGAANSGVDSE
jgi:TRAP-type C4-dicarboxylate transport system permease small subunit